MDPSNSLTYHVPQDSVTGLLLAGIGVQLNRQPSDILILADSSSQHVTAPPEAQKNFLVVDAKTETATIEQAFENFTHHRKDIAILFINQHVGDFFIPEKTASKLLSMRYN